MFCLGIRNCAKNAAGRKELSFQNGFGHECKEWWRKQWRIPRIGSTYCALISYLIYGTIAFHRKENKRNDNFLAKAVVSFGAGDRDRTGTLFTARDFKSLVSACSTTPAADSYDITFLSNRQVTAGPGSGRRGPGNCPGTSQAPAFAGPAWHPRSAGRRCRTRCCRPSAPPGI